MWVKCNRKLYAGCQEPWINDFFYLASTNKTASYCFVGSNKRWVLNWKLDIQIAENLISSLKWIKHCYLFFQHAFDHNKARNEGVILPKPGNVGEDSEGICPDTNPSRTIVVFLSF